MESSTRLKADAAPADASRGLDRRKEQAHIVEVFSSFQGEGPRVGERHIFVRFFACNLRCLYCDTPESLSGRPPARLETSPGSFEKVENPLRLSQVEAAIARLAEQPHDAISLTGGEPLLQCEFLRELLGRLGRSGLRAYLETNGTLPDHLARVIDQIDTVAMDIKLPETLADERDWFGEHREFLRVALQKEVFAKLVLPGAPDLSQVERAARMVADVARDRVALILQPVTPFGQITAAPTASDISRAYEVARRLLREVRVIPQTHKMIGLR